MYAAVRGMYAACLVFLGDFEVLRFRAPLQLLALCFFLRSLSDFVCLGGAMAEAIVAAEVAEAPQRVCTCCGKVVPEGQHLRAHGRQTFCGPCNSIDVMVRRNVGSWPELSQSEKHLFFTKAQQAKDDNGRCAWKVIRALLKETMVVKKTSTQSTEVKAPYKPKEYWLSQGYPEDKVLQCPCEDDPLLGRLYQVHTKTVSRTEVYEEIEEQLLLREQEVQRKKGNKGNSAQEGDDKTWVVPVEQTAKGAGGAKGSARSEEAAAKREQAKRARQNAAASTLAAKAVSQIQPKLDQVTKLLKSSGDKVTSEHRESLEACQTQMSAWLSTSRQVVTGYGADATACLPALPYTAADLKAAVTATGSTLKVAKDDVRAAKPAAKPAAKKAAQADAAHGPAKRRRTGKQS